MLFVRLFRNVNVNLRDTVIKHDRTKSCFSHNNLSVSTGNIYIAIELSLAKLYYPLTLNRISWNAFTNTKFRCALKDIMLD